MPEMENVAAMPPAAVGTVLECLRIVEEDSEHIDMGDTWQSEELGHGIDVLLDGRRVEHGRDAKLNGRAERKMRLCSKALERAIGIVGIRIEPEK